MLVRLCDFLLTSYIKNYVTNQLHFDERIPSDPAMKWFDEVDFEKIAQGWGCVCVWGGVRNFGPMMIDRRKIYLSGYNR